VNSEKKRPRAGFAVLVAAGIFLTRISGFVRLKIFTHYLGTSDAAGVFSSAYRIPNFLQNLFGEGVLSASFIPVYARLLAEGDEETAGRVAGIIASLLALAVAIIVLVCVIITPWILFVIAPGFTGAVRQLTIEVVRILFPGIGLLVMSAWCLGILNSHHRFFLPYIAPVFMNIAQIATLVIFGTRLRQADLAVALAWGAVAGAVLQFGIQVPFVFRYDKKIRFALETTLAPVREVLRNFTPVVVGRGVVQLSAYLDNILSTLLGTAAAASIFYAQTIAILPVSLFGMSVAAAELPQMSSAVGSDEEIFAALRKRMERGLRQIAFFVVPTVVAFIAIGKAIIGALLQGGQFHGNDAQCVWYILIGSTLGLLAVTLGRLYSSAFYALRDTKTPLRFAMIRVALTGLLGYLFAIPLRPLLIDALQLAHVPLPPIQGTLKPYGAIALTATAGIAGWLEFMLLRRALGRRIGAVPLSRAYLGKLWASAIAAGVAGATFYVYVIPRIGAYLPRVFPNIRNGIIVCGLFGVIYFAATTLLNVPESRATLGRFLLRSRS